LRDRRERTLAGRGRHGRKLPCELVRLDMHTVAILKAAHAEV
jgi:hypothetical protein